MTAESKSPGWWHTLPGMLTAIAAMLTAITGLIVAFSEAGFFKRDSSDVQAVIESEPSSVTAAKGSGLRVGPVRNRPAAIHGIDNPLQAALGTTYKLTLDANEETYFRFTAPGETRFVFDMRLPKNQFSNLQSKVLLLDQDGAPVGSPVINFNEIDVGHRMVTSVALKRGAVSGLKILNGGKLADLWVTLQPEPASQFIPFFGDIVPRQLKIREKATGSLDANEYAYYASAFGRGEYKIVLDVANADGKNTNIQGYLALLDADGGDQRIVIRLNEIDVSYRKTETFTLTRNQTLIIRIHNAAHPVHYTLLITAASS